MERRRGFLMSRFLKKTFYLKYLIPDLYFPSVDEMSTPYERKKKKEKEIRSRIILTVCISFERGYACRFIKASSTRQTVQNIKFHYDSLSLSLARKI